VPEDQVCQLQTLVQLPFKRMFPHRPIYASDPIGVPAHRFVLKRDDGGDQGSRRRSFELIAEMFRHVTPGFGEVRLLKSTEVGCLKAGRSQQGVVVAEGTANAIRIVDAQNESQDDKNGTTHGVHDTAGGFWYVMKFIHGLTHLERLQQHRAEQPEQRIIALIVGNPRMMEDLGKIFIVDLFVRYNDRFYVGEDEGCLIRNPGNIFVVTNENQTQGRFVGLDFFQADQSGFSNLFAALPQNQWWGGMHLEEGRKNEREELSRQAIRAIQQRNVGVGEEHRKKFRDGMSAGREALRNYLHVWKKKETLPAGIQDRMTKLGWT
jgi:hypothetical protein